MIGDDWDHPLIHMPTLLFIATQQRSTEDLEQAKEAVMGWVPLRQPWQLAVNSVQQMHTLHT